MSDSVVGPTALDSGQGGDVSASVVPEKGGVGAFKTGQVYRLYTRNTYLRQGQMAEFVKMVRQHCQLHGDFIGMQCRFVTVKESGRRSSMFDLSPASIERAEAVTAPVQESAARASDASPSVTGA